MNRLWGGALLTALLTACKGVAVAPAPSTMSGSPAELARGIAADASQSDQASDAKVRDQLAADALQKAGTCLGLAPQDAGCLYYNGVALGLDARAHPARALETLKSMLKALDAADERDPNYDEAGPARVRSLVLVRAPGWPLGPGDAEAGLASAKKAAALKPAYPPNLLALAEAELKNGDAAGAHATYERARRQAESYPPGREREDWLKQADEGLKKP